MHNRLKKLNALMIKNVIKNLMMSLLAVVIFSSTTAKAVEPDEILDNKALEARARNITSQLRCMQCQNESIDDSNAEIAKDLRLLVRERLVAGDSDKQIISFLVERFGNFVLLKPPFQGSMIILWVLPFIVLIMAIFIILLIWSRRQKEKLKPLSPAEKKALEDILNNKDDILNNKIK